MDRIIAIIGIGPRGGFAFEKLIEKLIQNKAFKQIHILLFEQSQNFGNGPVYDIDQNSSNWINITERILDLPKRKTLKFNSVLIKEFPSYKEWAFNDEGFDRTKLDTYPPRSKIGEYLYQRFDSLSKPLIKSGLISIINDRVEYLHWLKNGKLFLKTLNDEFKEIDEVLLTIGHQPTKKDKQILRWDKFASEHKNFKFFKEAYPTDLYLNSKILKNGTNIGVRGFGLAMIDIARAIALNFGNFICTDQDTKACKFNSASSFQNYIFPFSLDGLPPVPKPINATIDQNFKPTQQSLYQFEKIISDHKIQEFASSSKFLLDAFSPIAAKIFNDLPLKLKNDQTKNIENIIKKWLKESSYSHPLIISKDQTPDKSMRDFVGMAVGKFPVSLDYCVGQVWRHCQPTIYSALSHNNCNDEVFSDIIRIDESTKRYSYGPPVESIQQLLALIDAGFLNINFVNNPSIQLTKNGWKLALNNKHVHIKIMIDSVIDSPKVTEVTSPLIKKMLVDNVMEAVHSKLGVATDKFGYLVSKNINKKIPIALLGRLEKGTVIGVDAILECFGKRPELWAEKASEKHTKWLENNN